MPRHRRLLFLYLSCFSLGFVYLMFFSGLDLQVPLQAFSAIVPFPIVALAYWSISRKKQRTDQMSAKILER